MGSYYLLVVSGDMPWEDVLKSWYMFIYHQLVSTDNIRDRKDTTQALAF
jgi:hypothetical protein